MIDSNFKISKEAKRDDVQSDSEIVIVNNGKANKQFYMDQ